MPVITEEKRTELRAIWTGIFPTINDRQLALMVRVWEKGSSIGNTALRRELNWERDTYYEIRQPLLENGLLETGRGKGGSVRLSAKAIPEGPVAQPEENQAVAGGAGAALPEGPAQDETYSTENSLYDNLQKTLEQVWIGEQNFNNHEMVRTAAGGRRADGKWSRPDITVVAETHFRHLSGKTLDIVTFEIKHHTGFDITSVYEALSQRKAATYAYVLAYIPTAQKEDFADMIIEVTREANRHGIGLIIVEDPDNWETWEIVTDAIRVEPDRRLLNRFIENQLGKPAQDAIAGWFA